MAKRSSRSQKKKSDRSGGPEGARSGGRAPGGAGSGKFRPSPEKDRGADSGKPAPKKHPAPKTPEPEKTPRPAPPGEAPGKGPVDPALLDELEKNVEASFTHEEEARQREAKPIAADPEPESSAHAFLRPGIPSLFTVMITPELAPVAKIGGLADVVFGLTRELEIRGNAVEIVLPKYDCLRWKDIRDFTPAFEDLWVPWYDGAVHCTVYFGFVHDRKCFFIEPHSQDRFFERGKVYGDGDDTLRFAFFSRAAMEFLLQSGKHPDIIHCHDWQTALVPVFLYEIYQHLGMTHPRICYTIHNFKHQGLCGGDLLRAAGLNRPEYYFDDTRLGWTEPGCLNLMKGGIVYSNFVTTVSPTYAGEAKDQGNAFGLEPVLHTHQVKYGGVLNGVDCEVWNPSTDPHLPARYDSGNLEGKYETKRVLRQRFLLADNEKPIVAYVGRLDSQKGLDLVRHAIFYCVNHGAQFVLLGSAPEEAINEHFRRIKNEINENPDSHIEVGFEEELSRLIFAGSDMLIVPSRFEPCGLTQLIAMRYGTIPVVRAVGGLADTVFDKDYSDKPMNLRNGYVFHQDDNLGIESALSRAIACYYIYPDHFRHLILNAMHSDYSWNIPGQHYLNIYDHIRSK